MRPTLPNVPAGQVTAKENDEPRLIHRRVEITFEREVVSVHHQPACSFTGLCIDCGNDVLKLSAELAAATGAARPRQIYRWLEEKKLHFEETPSGQVFICSISLKKLTQTMKVAAPEARSTEKLRLVHFDHDLGSASGSFTNTAKV